MTIPNLITTLRIILTLIFIIYLVNDQFLAALVVLCLCGISDGLDGLRSPLYTNLVQDDGRQRGEGLTAAGDAVTP
jgi:hypothetical protein